ncbi:increased loss of mitochondrial DNA protein 1 [Pseudomassariella vexata]|uniref:Increased loss of mitochondrial DNA protein 1 n=1 Tax=Pseudomassariella vexata TaxID=1141098 RepID=A0A1Y2E6R5_9PEZI|nr:increased loss of mitochondrial DNA protein 1 [Pseudomassariella vexata]ORY66555.1 increased loss of mitochondrial DNA protein 1 [Pseudomassariella vexata]
MALISAKTILTSLSLFHITLAFFFFTNPESIADQALVYVLGEAMGMPQTTAFNTPTPTTSFLSIALLVLGLSDILSLSMPEEIWLVHYWGSQTPLRVILFSILTIFTFLTSGSSKRGGGRMSHPVAPSGLGLAAGGGWGGLRNRVFFTFAFFEMLSWFWVWVTLREEAGRFTQRKRRRSSAAAERY